MSQSITPLKSLDSTSETLLHIKRVNELLIWAAKEFLQRAVVHDNSKLQEPEKSMFDAVTQRLRGLTYGSEEYKESLKELGPALQHHYANNSHHPEHYLGGINEMTLFDILEMLLDWKAASERHADGDIFRSIALNQDRFGISDQLTQIFYNTANFLKNNQ